MPRRPMTVAYVSGSRYWCPGDLPGWERFSASPVYSKTVVPDDARCELCAESIPTLQRLLRGL